jgi:hypothetical protein
MLQRNIDKNVQDIRRLRKELATVSKSLTTIDESNLSGLQGVHGEQGVQGEQGVHGEQGIQGLPGSKGDSGSPGIQGVPGISSSLNNDGASGSPGPQGEKGDNGDKGEHGEQGVQGVQGEQGPSGTAGTQGVQGEGVFSFDLCNLPESSYSLPTSGHPNALQASVNQILKLMEHHGMVNLE